MPAILPLCSRSTISSAAHARLHCTAVHCRHVGYFYGGTECTVLWQPLTNLALTRSAACWALISQHAWQGAGASARLGEDFNLLRDGDFPSAMPGASGAPAAAGRWAGALGGGAAGGLRDEDFPSLPGGRSHGL